MIVNNTSTWTGLGVYTPDQAARLLGIRLDMVTRWVYGNDLGGAALIPSYPSHSGEFLTFIDLVQAMAINAIRRAKKLSLQKIRKTVDEATKHGIEYPFARKHQTYIFCDDVVLRLGDGRLIQVTGKYKENQLMEPVVESYLDDLGFDDRGLANIYVPIRQGYRRIVLTPTKNFGAPTVLPCGFSAATLLDAIVAEGSIEAAARICDVHEDDIRLCAQYEKRLFQAAA